jgi:hypothetical protein
MLLGDHTCLGFKKGVDEKKLKERKTERYSGL